MIESRKLVPDYYESSRDFQVFLKLLDLVVNVCDTDTKNLIELLSPHRCKARMLPLLSNYVGYTYDYQEKIITNRIITRNWPILKRNRGSIVGISMAVALAVSVSENIPLTAAFDLFSVREVLYHDSHGIPQTRLQVYIHKRNYLSKLYDLIEAVRPAGCKIEIISSIPVDSSETVVLTDQFKLIGYDYVTGKIIKIGDIPIIVENSWEILKEGQTTGEFIVDNQIYDQFHRPTGKRLDDLQRIYVGDSFTGEIVRAPYIYSISTYVEGTPDYLTYKDESGTLYTLVYSGKYFNLEKSARILNSCYPIKSGNSVTEYFVFDCSNNADESWAISDKTANNIVFYLKDYKLDNRIVKKVVRKSSEEFCNWHIDPETRYFVQDNIGEMLDRQKESIPWDEYCYISKRRCITSKSSSGILYTTEYFINDHEDIEDFAGNVILSVKDRYKVSDSSHIGFSEVHNLDRATDYSKTFLSSRSIFEGSDRDFYQHDKTDYNDYPSDSENVDTRVKVLQSDLHIDQIWREFDRTSNIGIITLSSYVDPSNPCRVRIDVDKILPDIRCGESYFYTTAALRPEDNIFSVFKELQFTFSNDEISDDKEVIMRWKPADGSDLYYNLSDLPDVVIFPHSGKIVKKRLYFTESPIIISSKVYDGSARCETYDIIKFGEQV